MYGFIVDGCKHVDFVFMLLCIGKINDSYSFGDLWFCIFGNGSYLIGCGEVVGIGELFF